MSCDVMSCDREGTAEIYICGGGLFSWFVNRLVE